jgi:Carboxypeptidase regulatory-like domain
MKACFRILVVLAALTVSAWGSGISVGYLKTIHVDFPGATAAYSLDPLYAEASASDGVLTVTGKAPGDASVVVVTPGGVRNVPVVIVPPPPSYPPGFVAPTTVSYFGASGTYEVRYSSDPSQWVNNLSFVRREGSRKIEFRFSNANMLRPNSDSPSISFPVLSYSISNQRRGITVLDEAVDNSALTVNGATVRGLHYWQGGWNFHAGFVSQTSFRDLLLSTERQEVAGVSRSFRLTKRSELIPNFYVFHMRGIASAGRNGEVASLLYRYKASEEFNYSVEIGASRGVAVAALLQYNTAANHLHAEFKNVPQQFAGLELNQLRGQIAQADFSRTISRRLSANLAFSRNSYVIAKQQNATTNTSVILRYELLRHWMVQGGAASSGFNSNGVSAYSFRSVNIPIGTDFATAHFGAGVQYQVSRNLAQSRNGNQIRGNARVGWGPVQVTGFVEQQTQTPVVQTTLTQNSPLADTVNNQAVLATTPEAVAAALRDNAALANLGYVQNAAVGLALRRRQLGGSLTWTQRGSGHGQFTYTFLRDSEQLITGRSGFVSHTITFSRQLTPSNEIGFSLALFSAGTALTGAYHARYQCDFRHRFSQMPSFFAPGGHGSISGNVFRDDAASGEYAPGLPPIAGAEIVLDGKQSRRSNEKGFYLFEHVVAGPHRIEIIPHTDGPSYFTTPSNSEVEINSRVNFGIAFASGHVFGYVRSDAGEPIAGVTVRLKSAQKEIELHTGDNGLFERDALPQGSYTVSVDADSVPAGYWLAGLKKQKLTVEPGRPAEVNFQVKASRAVIGHVLAYDPQKAREVPVAGAVVTLHEIPGAVVSDKNGIFRFKDLPAGPYTVAVVYKGKEITSTVTLAGGPSMVSDLDLKVGTK